MLVPSPQLVLGLGQYKDGGALTIVSQDDVGGLQVKCKPDSEWIFVVPTPNAFHLSLVTLCRSGPDISPPDPKRTKPPPRRRSPPNRLRTASATDNHHRLSASGKKPTKKKAQTETIYTREMQTAASSSANGTKAEAPNRAQRKGTEAERPTAAAKTDTTSWLPPGWVVEDRVRSSGATAGTKDKYYIDPVSGRRFRTKVDVLYYLETGTIRKKAKATDNSEGDINSSKGSGVQRNKKPATAAANSPVLDFDFAHPPDSAVWVLSHADEDTWTPFIGGKKVPEQEKHKWAAAFASLSTPNFGEKKS